MLALMFEGQWLRVCLEFLFLLSCSQGIHVCPWFSVLPHPNSHFAGKTGPELWQHNSSSDARGLLGLQVCVLMHERHELLHNNSRHVVSYCLINFPITVAHFCISKCGAFIGPKSILYFALWVGNIVRQYFEESLTLGSRIQTIIIYGNTMSKLPSAFPILYVTRLGLLIFCFLVKRESCFFGICADKVVGGTNFVPSFSCPIV